jgi:hypothetical protein
VLSKVWQFSHWLTKSLEYYVPGGPFQPSTAFDIAEPGTEDSIPGEGVIDRVEYYSKAPPFQTVHQI